MEHNDLKHYGYLFKTDKITKYGYHRFYHKELIEYKHKSIGLLEIGNILFNSIDMWKHYLPKAFIYGIDNNVSYEDARIKIFRKDNYDVNILEIIKPEIIHPIYVIIDNSYSLSNDIIKRFDYLFSNVLMDGGVYIIENIDISYWKTGNLSGNNIEYGYDNPNSIIEKFKIIVDYVNSYYLSDKDKEMLNEKSNFISNVTKNSILSIMFAHKCIIIKKKNLNDKLYVKNEYVNKNNVM